MRVFERRQNALHHMPRGSIGNAHPSSLTKAHHPSERDAGYVFEDEGRETGLFEERADLNDARVPQTGAYRCFAREHVAGALVVIRGSITPRQSRRRAAASRPGDRLDGHELSAAAAGKEHFADASRAEAFENLERAEGRRGLLVRKHVK